MKTIKRHIDYYAEDTVFLADFEKQVETLTGLVTEMLETNKVLVLSPVMREMVVDKAKEVLSKLNAVKWKLCVDNLNEPLKVSK